MVGVVARSRLNCCPGDKVFGIVARSVLKTRPGLVPTWPGAVANPTPDPFPCAMAEPANATLLITSVANSTCFIPPIAPSICRRANCPTVATYRFMCSKLGQKKSFLVGSIKCGSSEVRAVSEVHRIDQFKNAQRCILLPVPMARMLRT